jgi:integrase
MPRRSTAKLSDRFIKALPDPTRGSSIVYDADIPGFGIRLTTNGARSFVLNYVVNRRERRMTIGRFPAWSTSAAREEARSLRRKVSLGFDPLEEASARTSEAVAAREAPTVADLFERYAREHLPRKAPASAADDRHIWRTYILPVLGELQVAALTHDGVDGLHAEISTTKPVRANRVIEVLRKALNLAIRWGWRADNPATGVRRNHEEKRERYLTPRELMQLTTALAAHPERTSADAILLLLLTGARRSEALHATWDQFDLEAGVWVKPSSQTKQRRTHRVPLSSPAVDLLRRRWEARSGRYVFPGRERTGRPGEDRERPLACVRHSWRTVCLAAGLAVQQPLKRRDGQPRLDDQGKPVVEWRPTARLHDLRHTYASILASRGLSLPVIGALLGHTQPQTTARYAHLLDDPLRAATEAVAQAVAGQ